MDIFLKKNLLILSLFFSIFMPAAIFAATDSIDVSAEVYLEGGTTCNSNGICEPGLGETVALCPSDCGCNHDGICQSQRAENINNCADDCGTSNIIQGGSALFKIINLSVENIAFNSADIVWDTNIYSYCKISWGKTSEYKEGNISEAIFSENHKISLNGLESGAKYHFFIVCTTMLGSKADSGDQEFNLLDNTAPANVDNFVAEAGDEKVFLSWENPLDADFKGVRIIRSDKFYPSDILDGETIYNGNGISYIDENLENGKRYYYTAFAYDSNGNYSSGAIASAVPYAEGGPIIVPPISPEEIPSEIPLTPEIEKLKIEDFDFFLEGKKVSIKDGKIIGTIAKSPLTISLSYEKVPEILKTIMVTLEKDSKSFSFLLKINQDKTAYTAVLVSPEEAGIYPLIASILDYKNHTLKKISGELEVIGKGKSDLDNGFLLWKSKADFYRFLLIFLAFILLLVLIIVAIKLLKEKIKNNKNSKKAISAGYLQDNYKSTK